VLKLEKKFITETEPVKLATGPGVLASEPDKNAPRGDKRFFEDVLDTSFTPKGGRFEWNINPSTRPIVETKTFPGTIADQPSRKDAFSGGATDGDVVDKEFTVTEEDRATILDIKFDSQLNDDYDIELYLRKGAELEKVGNSGNFAPDDPTDPTGPNERITLDAPPVGTYVLRVINYAAVGPWSATVERFPTGPNKVVSRQEGDLDAALRDGRAASCYRAAGPRRPRADARRRPGLRRRRAADPRDAVGGRQAAVAPARPGFASASAKRVAGRWRSASSASSRAVTVDVFQASSGRQIFGERRVARFSRRTRASPGTAARRRASRSATASSSRGSGSRAPSGWTSAA
jgi:hypothetical protein